MKIAGISRVRNEETIIENTLSHVSKLVDEIYIYDDCSYDNTVKICKSNSKVKGVIEGKFWDDTPKGREIAEGSLRQKVYKMSVENGADWVYYFDADEYVEFDNIDFTYDNYYFRLFDFYITKDDIKDNYLDRKWMGPEYRDIPMLFKVKEGLFFKQRIPNGISNSKFGGYVKHYGKAISVEEWDKTCDYYINNRWNGINEELHKRWLDRVGKSIHEKSDFGNDLITWDERKNINKIIKL